MPGLTRPQRGVSVFLGDPLLSVVGGTHFTISCSMFIVCDFMS